MLMYEQHHRGKFACALYRLYSIHLCFTPKVQALSVLSALFCHLDADEDLRMQWLGHPSSSQDCM